MKRRWLRRRMDRGITLNLVRIFKIKKSMLSLFRTNTRSRDGDRGKIVGRRVTLRTSRS